MTVIKTLVIAAAVGLLAGIAFLYSGMYPMGADVPHNQLTYWALETLREHSIAQASHNIVVPELNNPDQLIAGGADYNDMCAGCHLKPGQSKSDFTIGLYPAPPNLTQASRADPTAQAQRRFWSIKHGIKASGMPAWGMTHDDKRIWDMVAFLQRLPELTRDEYAILTSRGDTNTGTHRH